MERREFIKTSCSLCLAVGGGMAMSALSSCATFPVYSAIVADGTLSVPLSVFSENKIQIIRPIGREYDIALRKEENGTFRALMLRCTHASNPLTYSGDGYTCRLHGSSFDAEGKVTHGPAEIPLTTFDTKLIGDSVQIIVM